MFNAIIQTLPPPNVDITFKTTDTGAWGTSNYHNAYSLIKDLGNTGAFTFDGVNTAIKCNRAGFYEVTIECELTVSTAGDREVELRYRQDPNTGTYDQLPENAIIMAGGAFANPSNHTKRVGILPIPRVFIGLDHKIRVQLFERSTPPTVDGSYTNVTDQCFVKIISRP